MKKISLLCLVAMVTGLLAGCRTPTPRTAAAQTNTQDEWVWYTPTGSHIPIRIRKSEISDRQNTKNDQEAMRDATRRGLHMDRKGD